MAKTDLNLNFSKQKIGKLFPRGGFFEPKVLENSQKHPRIFNGSIATANIYPYMALLELYTSELEERLCGGVIITERYVLTAAHCLDEIMAAYVILGAHDKDNTEEFGRVTHVVPSGNFVIHRNYEHDLRVNDVALIRLAAAITFNTYIEAVHLPTGADENATFVGDRGVIIGWGYYNNSMIYAQKLRVGKALILSNAACRPLNIRNSNICLDGSTSVGTCVGDSGGPLLIRNTAGNPMVVGITSSNFDDCSKRLATVYTRVTSFVRWIRRNAGLSIGPD